MRRPEKEKALALPKGAITSVGTLGQPKPKINVQFGKERMVTCGVARGLSAGE